MAQDRRISYVWSGIMLDSYFRENLDYGIFHKIIELVKTVDHDGQESGYLIKYV